MILEYFQEQLSDYKEGYFDHYKGILGPICEEATKEIREKIQNSWIGKEYGSLNAATHQYPKVKTTESTIQCITDTKVLSEDFYPPSQTASAWVGRHGGSDWQQWILDMQYDLGYLGLPACSGDIGPILPGQRTDWVAHGNMHKKQEELLSYTENHPEWDSFEKKVISKL